MTNFVEDGVNEISMNSNFSITPYKYSLREIKTQSSLSQAFLNWVRSVEVWANRLTGDERDGRWNCTKTSKILASQERVAKTRGKYRSLAQVKKGSD